MDKYVLEASQFNPGQILTFRVQAVNSLFNGEFSDEYKFSIEHSVIEDTIENIQVVSKSDSKVNIKWSKVIPKENSALNNGSTWFYRYIYLLLFAQCLLFNCLKYIYIYIYISKLFVYFNQVFKESMTNESRFQKTLINFSLLVH